MEEKFKKQQEDFEEFKKHFQKQRDEDFEKFNKQREDFEVQETTR